MELLTIAKTKALITSIKKTVDKLDDQIHLAGLSALYHYANVEDGKEATGDATLVTQLVKATAAYNQNTGEFDGRSVRGAALRTWITTYSNLVWDKKKYGGEGGYVKAKKGETPWVDLEMAEADPFYSMTRDKVPSEYLDWFKRANSLISSLSSALKKGRIKEDEKPNVVALMHGLEKLLKAPVQVGKIDNDNDVDEQLKELFAIIDSDEIEEAA